MLVGLTLDDEQKDVEWMVKKITNLRVFEDPTGKPWTKSAKDLDLEILSGKINNWNSSLWVVIMTLSSVSQFTLFALTNKGSKPDFHLGMSIPLIRIDSQLNHHSYEE